MGVIYKDKHHWNREELMLDYPDATVNQINSIQDGIDSFFNKEEEEHNALIEARKDRIEWLRYKKSLGQQLSEDEKEELMFLEPPAEVEEE